jgi:hypothetical protein
MTMHNHFFRSKSLLTVDDHKSQSSNNKSFLRFCMNCCKSLFSSLIAILPDEVKSSKQDLLKLAMTKVIMNKREDEFIDATRIDTAAFDDDVVRLHKQLIQTIIKKQVYHSNYFSIRVSIAQKESSSSSSSFLWWDYFGFQSSKIETDLNRFGGILNLIVSIYILLKPSSSSNDDSSKDDNLLSGVEILEIANERAIGDGSFPFILCLIEYLRRILEIMIDENKFDQMIIKIHTGKIKTTTVIDNDNEPRIKLSCYDHHRQRESSACLCALSTVSLLGGYYF